MQTNSNQDLAEVRKMTRKVDIKGKGSTVRIKEHQQKIKTAIAMYMPHLFKLHMVQTIQTHRLVQ